jgi:hypothetical protein
MSEYGGQPIRSRVACWYLAASKGIVARWSRPITTEDNTIYVILTTVGRAEVCIRAKKNSNISNN